MRKEIKNNNKRKALGIICKSICIMLSPMLLIGVTYAGDVNNYVGGNMQSWLHNLVSQVLMVEAFLQIIATVAGIIYAVHGLTLLRKHHMTQGGQSEFSKQGVTSLFIGVALMCIIPLVQMAQKSFMGGAGKGSAQQTFNIDQQARQNITG